MSRGDFIREFAAGSHLFLRGQTRPYPGAGNYSSVWLTWWLGDAVSDLIVAPLLLVWFVMPSLRRGRWAEFIAMLAVVFVTGQSVFGGWFLSAIKNYPLTYLSIPPLIWAS